MIFYSSSFASSCFSNCSNFKLLRIYLMIFNWSTLSDWPCWTTLSCLNTSSATASLSITFLRFYLFSSNFGTKFCKISFWHSLSGWFCRALLKLYYSLIWFSSIYCGFSTSNLAKEKCDDDGCLLAAWIGVVIRSGIIVPGERPRGRTPL